MKNYYPDWQEPQTAFQQDEKEENYVDRIPSGGGTKAVQAGLLTGIISALINVLITLLSSPLYQQVATQTSSGSVTSVDVVIALGLPCLNLCIIVLVCFFAGFNAGKRAVLRKFGFLAGALAGFVMYLCGFLTRYIPNYPGNILSQGASYVIASSSQFLASLVFLLFWIFIGGLVGLWGAASATRKHPYYAG